MKKTIYTLLVACMLTAGINVKAELPKGSSANCVIPKIDGEKVPFPRLREANTKYDLAEDETYILNGQMINQGGRTLLKLDFNSQPWLATAARLANPYVEVSALSGAHTYSGMMVSVAVVARRLCTEKAGTSVELLAKPVPYREMW